MSRRHGHSGVMPKRRAAFVMSALIVVFAVVTAYIFATGGLNSEINSGETFGNLEERFPEALTLNYGGEAYSYRRSELVNILIIGVDRNSMDDGVDSLRFGSQADFMMLLCVDTANNTVTPLQIDRDTMARIDVYGVFGDYSGSMNTQICLAQAFSKTGSTGSGNTLSAVSELLGGVPIDHYFTVDMSGIGVLNDSLGGVTITLDEDFTQFDASMAKGATVKLTGAQAEIYVRSRMSVSDGTNHARMARQRNYIDAAFRTLLARVDEDADFLTVLLDTLAGNAETDMTNSYLVNEVSRYMRYNRAEIAVIDGVYSTDGDGFVQFFPDQGCLYRLLIDLFFVQTD